MTAPSAGGRLRRDLQAVEAAPRLADDADAARAPRLRGEPFDHLEPSSCSCGRYSSSRSPPESPEPRCRRARPHSRGRRTRVHVASRSPCRRPCGTGCTRGSRVPGPSRVIGQPDAGGQTSVRQRDPRVRSCARGARNRCGSACGYSRCPATARVAVDAAADSRTRCQWWQATAWPASIGASGGASSRQMSVANGQRVWKRHAGGGLRGLGISPGTSRRWRRPVRLGRAPRAPRAGPRCRGGPVP